MYPQHTDTTGSVKHFSISKSNSREARYHHTFDPKAGDFAHIVHMATQYAWSPIVWEKGRRAKVNFQSCSLVVLDVDGGFPLEDAKQWLRGLGYTSAILLSKSHQKQKGESGPCDRYRILIAAKTLLDGSQYEENMRWWHRQLPMADASCSDGGRFFFASPVFAWAMDGEEYEWKDYSQEIERKKKAMDEYRKSLRKKFEGTGCISERLRMKIKLGAPEGLRHKTAYALGAAMAELGIDYHKSVQMICSGPLADIGIRDVEDCVRKARKKVLG